MNQLHSNSWWNTEHRGVTDHELELEVSNIINKDPLWWKDRNNISNNVDTPTK